MSTFAPQQLKEFAASLLQRLHVPEEDALLVADVLVRADLEGVETHGLGRLPNYVERLRKGAINPRPNMAVVREKGAGALLDAANGMGQVAAARAMDEAIRRARTHGIGWVGVRRSGHFGAASYYVQKAADQGMAGLAFSNSPPGMAPWGGRTAFLGTNPVGFGFPAGGRPPVIIDFATSVAARGQVLKARKAGQKIPLGWAVDEQGRPTEDPDAALRGALLPLGGAKGYGLALAVEILAAVLTGAAISPEIPSFFDNMTDESNVGHAMVAVDISTFVDPEFFARRMEMLVDGLKAVPAAEGVDRVLIPGERRALKRARGEAVGLLLNPATVSQLNAIAGELGVPELAT